MDEEMFWDMDGDDTLGDEEEDYVSANDPFRGEEDPFSPYEKYPDESSVIDSMELGSTGPSAASMAVLGAMCETEGKSDTIFVDDEKVVKYVSMKNYMDSKKPKTQKKARRLRPFEQWYQDVLDGKKTREDPI